MRELQCFFLLFFAAAAAFGDLKYGRIPNLLILAGLLTGCCMQLAENEILGAFWFLGGAGIPILTAAFLYYFRMIGGGDIKLLSLVGGFLGIEKILICMGISLLAGAFFSAILLWKKRNLKERLEYFLNYAAAMKETGKWKPYIKEGDAGKIPFSPAILVAVLCYAGGVY